MSSLRIDSLRLVWLETFVEVANAENISAAAREMSVDQSTVSRNLQALQKWLGKTLVEPGKVSDPEDPGVNVGLTEDGRLFLDIAENVIAQLQGFRVEDVRRDELLARIEKMVGTMQLDRGSKHPSRTVQVINDQLDIQISTLENLRGGLPLSLIEGMYPRFRLFFATYEDHVSKERRRAARRRDRPPTRAPKLR